VVSEPVERMIDVGDGARLWTVSEGAGRPVVLCHGGPGGIDNLGPVAGMIVDFARVHRYEQRGCGRSTGGQPFTMQAAVGDLEALRLHWGYERWAVAGHSFGAALALAYALEHPAAVEAVVYVSCILRLAGQPDWYEQYRQARIARMGEAARERYLELRRLQDELGELPSRLRDEMVALTLDVEFGSPRAAAHLRSRLRAELSAKNAAVNDELGGDFVRYFAASGVARRLAGSMCLSYSYMGAPTLARSPPWTRSRLTCVNPSWSASTAWDICRFSNRPDCSGRSCATFSAQGAEPRRPASIAARAHRRAREASRVARN
jgi:pimeloyl-ACP methyl ester carboxylesterase